MYPTKQMAEARAATLSTNTRILKVTREYADHQGLPASAVGKFILIVLDGPKPDKIKK